MVQCCDKANGARGRSYAGLHRGGQARFQPQLAYRTANLAGLATNAFWDTLRFFLFPPLFQGREVAAIRDRFGVERTLVVDLAEDETLTDPLTVEPAAQVRADGPRRWLRFRRDEITPAELIAAVSARYRIHDVTIEEPEIEGIIRRIYEEGL